MQQRHKDRRQYFNELANTSRMHYIDYLKPFITLSHETRVLEIGCGEGGNLLPFAEAGCQVTGIDLNAERIRQAQKYFGETGCEGTFYCQDFLKTQDPREDEERFHLVLMHDVIEHIEPEQKESFLGHVRSFMKKDGILFIGFPAWQMPFGGHQQIARGVVSKIPYVHLLPNLFYRSLIHMGGNAERCVEELMSIKRARMTIERLERLVVRNDFVIRQRTLWLVNPHYEQKFHLKPRRLWGWSARLAYIRNYYTTSAFYLLALKC